MGNTNRTEDKKGKKKRALLVLTNLHKHLQSSCHTYNSAKKWQQMIKEKLEPILDEFAVVLPQDLCNKLREAKEVDDTSASGISRACKMLKSNLAKAIHALTPSPLGLLAKALFLGGVVAVGAGIIYMKSSAVDIIIQNSGCETIYPIISMPVKFPGLSIPNTPLVTGGSMKVRIPGITAHVDNSDQQTITVSLLGARMNFTLDPTIDLTFDGVSLRGTQTTLQLGDKPAHNLLIACQ